MITDENVKKQVTSWVNKVGPKFAIAKLCGRGISLRMAQYLIVGKYRHNISLKKAEQILKAIT